MSTTKRATARGCTHRICYMAFKTPDGKPFPDNARNWECGGGDPKKQPDGTWHCPLKLDAYSLFAKEEGVLAEFHVVNGATPYPSEETVKTMYIQFK